MKNDLHEFLQDNLRIILSVIIVLVIAAGIWLYANPSRQKENKFLEDYGRAEFEDNCDCSTK